jgi:hypothetical protein
MQYSHLEDQTIVITSLWISGDNSQAAVSTDVGGHGYS